MLFYNINKLSILNSPEFNYLMAEKLYSDYKIIKIIILLLKLERLQIVIIYVYYIKIRNTEK